MTIEHDALAGLSAPQREAISAFLESTKADTADATSHGALDVPKFLRLILEDLALAVHRPGSWEGHNMRTLLASHGYRALDEHVRCVRARQAYWNGRDPYAR